ncbi:E3 ubiquitin protein ligase DRIP2 [Vitis vinifera]|uniref:E3 ubiquitin protein ligase DRIP2 n=1 Tax=Vitis vinifera TaxID=29760 RepID=A0A438IHD5_VITVI|nr:E3 ubiquitin protein ligase DRIP2 [Vitis vinifera]
MRDGNLPVSFIQKYLVKKLDLTNEAEVEIRCQGEAVVPTLQLQKLVELWLRTASTSKRAATSVGTSAKEFVMVLTYTRVQAP